MPEITVDQVAALFNTLNTKIDEKHDAIRATVNARSDQLDAKLDRFEDKLGAVRDRVLIIEEGRKGEREQRESLVASAQKRATLMSTIIAVGINGLFKLSDLFLHRG